MRRILMILSFCYCFCLGSFAQDEAKETYEKHGVVWSAGVFKAWLKDNYVGFNKIGSKVKPVFSEQKKEGIAIKSHYMYKPNAWMGLGVHLGLGLDLHSYIEAPVLLFGFSFSYGKKHQLIIDVGWADGKRKIITGDVRNDLINGNYTEIPEVYELTELNTGFYLGIGYRVF